MTTTKGGNVSVALLLMTDGRDPLLHLTIQSALTNLMGKLDHLVIHTDAGHEHGRHLNSVYPEFDIVSNPQRLGFGGAIRHAWKIVNEEYSPDYLFHLEDDFTFNRYVPIDGMKDVLHHHPHLTQLALRRQPWNEQEKAAGGIVEMWPNEYEEKDWGVHVWLEHKLFVSTNPCLFPRRIVEKGWPDIPRSEEAFSQQLFTEDSLARSGFWGSRHSGEWVFHTGEQRVGSGY